MDDDEAAARVFAELIESRTRLRTVVASAPDEAISIAEQNHLLVLVLDEKMPLMAGTELYSHLRRLAPTARAVMLTQEEDVGAAQRATNLGYRYHMHKSHITDLPSKVLDLYTEAVAADLRVEKLEAPIVLWRQRRWGRPVHEVHLLSAETLDETAVIDAEWQAYVTVNAGQKLTQLFELEHSTSVRLEAESRDEVKFSSGISIPAAKLELGLERAAEKRELAATSSDHRAMQRLEETFELPPEPEDQTKLHVKARQFELAPVYRRLRLFLEAHCCACGQESKSMTVVLQPRRVVALRQTDYFSDDSVRVVATGYRLIV